MKKFKNLFIGFSIKKLLLCILCSIIITTFISSIIIVVRLIASELTYEYYYDTDSHSDELIAIGKRFEEAYGHYEKEKIEQQIKKYGPDYPAKGVYLYHLLTYSIDREFVLSTFYIGFILGLAMGSSFYIIFIKKSKNIQLLIGFIIIILLTLLLFKLSNYVKYLIMHRYFDIMIFDEIETQFLIIPYIVVFLLVYIVNFAYQKFLSHKLNKILKKGD